MKGRVRPHHLVVGFGVFWALFSIGSGVAPLIFGWFDDSPVQREVFLNIPGPWKLAFYTLLPVIFVYGSVLFANRVKNWERGAPDARATTVSTAPPNVTIATSTLFEAKLSVDNSSLYAISPAFSSAIGEPDMESETSRSSTHGTRGSGFSAKLLVPNGI